ncbi:UDP-N-acetylmuramoyl-L-alanine--D-glutamate ligase [Acidimicrobiales bacterium]|nr:UDP-N-acetylmuramoyl-L-alanine--D-glutamate ligase [Acidimicrobiales bacterium]
MRGPIARALDAGSCTILLVGMGITNRAVAGALLRRGHTVIASDDNVDDGLRQAVVALDIELHAAPDESVLESLVEQADLVCPAPGLPEHHPVFSLARDKERPLVGEFDLAAAWDERPIAAITGTNGKTTVVELAVAALQHSGLNAVAAGNTDVPLVRAIDDLTIDVFVVEASSFRLARASEFQVAVATWLNFAPDHLDVHSDLESYERAKAEIFAMVGTDGIIVANAEDPVVMRHVPESANVVTFGGENADWHLQGDDLVGPEGAFTSIDRLWRSLPHDIEDALAVAATTIPVGATLSAVAEACERFAGLAHRVSPVGKIDGVTYFDDSKATTPHATVAALRGFEKVVLIAGGRNKGIDLSSMRDAGAHVHAVVAIGDSADEITSVFSSTHEVVVAYDMHEAVVAARRLAEGRVAVLLSPGCASFDWYRNYGDRGDDFARIVRKYNEECVR